VSESIEIRLKAKAREMGFDLVGIARASEADGFERYCDWLKRGFAGEMNYLHQRAEARRHPESILDGVRSVVMVGVAYAGTPHPSGPPLPQTGEGGASGRHVLAIASDRSQDQPPPSPPKVGEGGRGGEGARVAKYAQAPDYHQFLWDKLNPLGDWLDSQLPGTRSRGIVDSAPLLERDFARRAGLGWIGKNTMLINKQLGSFFVLGALLTTAELEPDSPHLTEHCGTCTACLDACPTQAFTAPGWLDARRCISYLTIELKTAVPEDLRPGVGDWLFGCDICQDVCPWNHRPNLSPGLPPRPELAEIDPIELLSLSPEELRRRFKGTSLRRANWRGLLRNAAIVLGNRGDPRALRALREALRWDDEVVREACEWAIRKIEASGAA
jgi:epoxyqueuosine reductase